MKPEETPLSKARRETAAGVLYAGMAFFIWGVSPVYWKAMQQVPALEIVTHRVVWSFVFLIGLTLIGNFVIGRFRGGSLKKGLGM